MLQNATDKSTSNMSMHNVCYIGGMYMQVGRSCFNVTLNGRRRYA